MNKIIVFLIIEKKQSFTIEEEFLVVIKVSCCVGNPVFLPESKVCIILRSKYIKNKILKCVKCLKTFDAFQTWIKTIAS